MLHGLKYENFTEDFIEIENILKFEHLKFTRNLLDIPRTSFYV